MLQSVRVLVAIYLRIEEFSKVLGLMEDYDFPFRGNYTNVLLILVIVFIVCVVYDVVYHIHFIRLIFLCFLYNIQHALYI